MSEPSRAPREGFDPSWQVPDFTASEFGRRMHRHCVIVPVIDEGGKFVDQLVRMRGAGLLADVVVADGGSTDGSTRHGVLREAGVRALLVKTGPGRLGAQLRMAMAWALAQGYEGVVCIDGNGKDGVEAIPSFLRALDEGWDFVQGSRYVPGGVAINTPRDRHLAVKLVHAPLTSLAAGFRYTDTTNGFRAFSARLLLDPRVAPFRDRFSRYELHYYLSIRAARLGFRVRELPVTRAYPASGPTPTRISGMRGRLSILRQLAESALGRHNP